MEGLAEGIPGMVQSTKEILLVPLIEDMGIHPDTIRTVPLMELSR